MIEARLLAALDIGCLPPARDRDDDETATPRFLAQPPLLPVDPDNRPGGAPNAVEQATARALAGEL